jgi:hypothetical protein
VKIVLSADGVATSSLVPMRGAGGVAINREAGATKPDSTGAAATGLVDVSVTGATPLRPGSDPTFMVRAAVGADGPAVLPRRFVVAERSDVAAARVGAAGGSPVPPSVDPISERAMSVSAPPREITFATVDATTGAAAVTGAVTVAESVFTVATADVAAFVTAFASGAAALATGVTALRTVAAALLTGAVAFVTGATAFVTGAAAFATVAAALLTGAAALVAALVTGAAAFVTGAAALFTGAVAVATGAAALVTGAAAFVTGAAALFAGGAVAVATRAAALFTGAVAVETGAGALWVVCVGVDDEVGAATGTEDVTGAVDFETVLVDGAVIDVGAAGCGAAATIGPADGAASCACATPASAAKQATTPATRIDRVRILARVNMSFLFPTCEQVSRKPGLCALKKVEFASRRRLSPGLCDICSPCRLRSQPVSRQRR